jgi:circadian clock protein KaiC
MKNSNQVREFTITDKGIEIVDVTIGPDGVLVGSARDAYRLEKETGEMLRKSALKRKDKEIENKRMILEGKISRLNSEFELVKDEINRIYAEDELRNDVGEKNRQELISIRKNKKN